MESKGAFWYSAVYGPLDYSKRFTLHPYSYTNSTSYGSIQSATLQLLNDDYTLTYFNHCLLSGTRLYSWVNWGNCQIFEIAAERDWNPDPLIWESDILRLSYQV